MTRKATLLKGWSWFKFINLGLGIGMTWTFYTSVSKGLKVKVRKFWELSPTFLEVKKKMIVRKSVNRVTQKNPGNLCFVSASKLYDFTELFNRFYFTHFKITWKFKLFKNLFSSSFKIHLIIVSEDTVLKITYILNKRFLRLVFLVSLYQRLFLYGPFWSTTSLFGMFLILNSREITS